MENQTQTGGQQSNRKPPLHRIHGKGGVFLNIWEKNSQENGPFISTELGRTYKDDEGQWRISRNLTLDQLNQLPGMIAEAGMHIRQWEHQQRQQRREQRAGQTVNQSQSHGIEAQHDQVMAQAVETMPTQSAPDQHYGPER